ncbi:MAG: dTDP-4-dehydrorhamnose reductase [Nitrospirae bacterium]|nr:dTDP-4-dehydrorhamnose reductase [Nitrospirota bacterium]
MRVLILGGRGQLGTALTDLLKERENGNCHSATSAEADLRKPETLRDTVGRFRPDVVINTAAYNFVDRAEQEVREAFMTNAVGVRELAVVCRDAGAVLIHCSTNYVFDGRKKTPYGESDAPNPLCVYGLSKLAGEVMVARTWEKHFIVRSSGLYGTARSDRIKKNFVEQMLARTGEQAEVRVVRDQRCTPTYCRDLAGALLRLAASRRYGLYHITNGGACSWAEFAREIFRQSGKKIRVKGVLTAAFPTAAERPRNTVLANRNFRRAGFTPLRDWQAALADYLKNRPSGSTQT